jgi:predicted O-methyltransferase YrrM
MAFRIRDIFRLLGAGGPGHLFRFAHERLSSFRSFRRWVQSLPPETPIEQVADVVVNRTHGANQPVFAWQKEKEILALLHRLQELKPRRILEIGTAAGGTLLLLTRVAAPDALLVSIDMPEGGFGGGYNLLRAGLYKSFARSGQRIVLIRGDSHRQAVRERMARALGGEKLDFLFIDGDHSAAGSRQDFDDYAPYVRPGGLIAFHDIRPDAKGWSGEVHRVWAEVAAQFNGEELVDASGAEGYGIGLLRWPG